MSGIADPFNGHIDEFRISHLQRSDGWIETTWNNMSNPGAFAVAEAEEQEGGGGEGADLNTVVPLPYRTACWLSKGGSTSGAV